LYSFNCDNIHVRKIESFFVTQQWPFIFLKAHTRTNIEYHDDLDKSAPGVVDTGGLLENAGGLLTIGIGFIGEALTGGAALTVGRFIILIAWGDDTLPRVNTKGNPMVCSNLTFSIVMFDFSRRQNRRY
jgi:hypothetical protein